MRYDVLLLLILAALPALAQPDTAYWRLDDVYDRLNELANAYPDLVHLTSLGASGEGAPVPLACLSDHAAVREREAGVFIHAAMHANECNGTGAVMHAMERLLSGYGHDPAVTARLDSLEIWFAPIVNVDGHRRVFSGLDHWEDWRKTLRDNDGDGQVDFPGDGVDINRNWDWRWEESDEVDPASQYYKGPFPWSEPETRALRDFILAQRPLLVADLHSPVTISWNRTVFYPWTGGGGQSPDFAVARSVSEAWAEATISLPGNPYGVIFGYDTLPKEQCWVYGETGIISLLMEIEDQCWFEGADVDTVAHRVGRGLMALLDRAVAGPGLRGRVTDAHTGQPLPAEVVVVEVHDADIGPRLCDAVVGGFQRLLEPGDYTLHVSFRDYVERAVPVTVGPGWTTLDLALEPVVTLAPGEETTFRLRAANPLRGGQEIRLWLPAAAPPGTAVLYDLRGRETACLGRDLAGGRDLRLAIPRGLPDGVYLLRVTAGHASWTSRLALVR